MISTFVSLAAIVAGAPFSIEPVPTPVPVPAPIAAVVTDRPEPLIAVRSPQGADDPLIEPTARPSAEILQQEPVIPNVVSEDEAAGDPAPTVPVTDPTFVSPTEQRAILKAAGGALSAVETAQGRFVQIDPTGRRATGDFALQRPGRMRFDYDAPVPLLIAADGATVAVRDDELETVDRVPLAATPLNLLLDDRIDFETEAEVMRVIKGNGQVAITMRDRTGEADGELTLYLDSASYDLMGWRTLDGNDRLTFVELSNVDTGINLNPRLFLIEDFDEDDDDDRR